MNSDGITGDGKIQEKKLIRKFNERPHFDILRLFARLSLDENNNIASFRLTSHRLLKRM